MVAVASPDGEDGLFQVEVVDRKGDLALVRLPSETFENGYYITVKEMQLQAEPQHQKVGA